MSAKGHELTASKAKVHDLEQILAKKDKALAEQKSHAQSVEEETAAALAAAESAHAALKEVVSQQGMDMMHLRDQLAASQNARPRNLASSLSGGAPSSAGLRRGSMASAGVAIAARGGAGSEVRKKAGAGGMVMPVGSVIVKGIDDKPFVVGSPPSSSNGSYASENRLRRAVQQVRLTLKLFVVLRVEAMMYSKF